jgi:predicted permease
VGQNIELFNLKAHTLIQAFQGPPLSALIFGFITDLLSGQIE